MIINLVLAGNCVVLAIVIVRLKFFNEKIERTRCFRNAPVGTVNH
ncbi:MAG: hypothetical protein CM1200mP9_09990 [Gammaproteobacteria bacterium]|nr:MAG: hypothetical protein CM1200mP9_09990 [Gammaproteobacteria bacterium]